MKHTFSVIIPVYNVAPYLRECLDSALAAARTLSEKCGVRSEKCGDVNISFGTALRFAHALKMDFTPVLTPEEETYKGSDPL